MNGAVVDEMLTLDPDVVVVKGDLTDTGKAEEYEAFLACYGRLGPPCTTCAATTTPCATPSSRGGRALRDPARRRDAGRARHRGPGLDRRNARRGQRGWLDELAASTPIPSGVRAPPGVQPRPDYGLAIDDYEALLAVFARRENIVGYLAGHTHCNHVARDPRGRDVPCVEVACAKDYPGAWGEYHSTRAATPR